MQSAPSLPMHQLFVAQRFFPKRELQVSGNPGRGLLAGGGPACSPSINPGNSRWSRSVRAESPRSRSLRLTPGRRGTVFVSCRVAAACFFAFALVDLGVALAGLTSSLWGGLLGGLRPPCRLRLLWSVRKATRFAAAQNNSFSAGNHSANHCARFDHLHLFRGAVFVATSGMLWLASTFCFPKAPSLTTCRAASAPLPWLPQHSSPVALESHASGIPDVVRSRVLISWSTHRDSAPCQSRIPFAHAARAAGAIQRRYCVVFVSPALSVSELLVSTDVVIFVSAGWILGFPPLCGRNFDFNGNR